MRLAMFEENGRAGIAASADAAAFRGALDGDAGYPGDLIVTGTPAGVGGAREPPVRVEAGGACEAEVDGLGTLRTPVADQQA